MKKIIKVSLVLALITSCAPMQKVQVQRITQDGETTGRTTVIKLTNKQFLEMMDTERLIYRNRSKSKNLDK